MLRFLAAPMNVKRVLVLGAVCGVLAALLSSAATSGDHRIPPPVVRKTTEVEANGAALTAEIARLHDRLRPTAAPEGPGRNLFQFGSRAAHSVAPPPVEPPIAPTAPVAVPARRPNFTLIGVAEDAGPDGPVRTAIVSAEGELILAKEGDAVTPQFRATRIAADGLDLKNVDDGTAFHLNLR